MTRLTLADLTEDEYSRVLVSVHEASHAVMATLYGGDVLEAVASAERGHVTCERDPDPHKAPGAAWAGKFAELLFEYGDQPPAKAIAEAYADMTPEDKAHVRGRPTWVENEVRFAMPAIKRLAAFLYKTGRATSLQVHGALGVRPGVDIDTVRHCYRNGIRPADFTPAGAA